MLKRFLIIIVVIFLTNIVHAQTIILTGTQQAQVTSNCTEVTLYDKSAASVYSGGLVFTLNSYDDSLVGVYSGGAVVDMTVYGNSALHISNGQVGLLHLKNLKLNGPSRVILTAGFISMLSPEVSLDAFQNFNLSQTFTHSDLSNYGVSVTGSGSITSLLPLDIVTTSNSRINISGGNVGVIELKKTCRGLISGGSVEKLYCRYNATAEIFGGSVTEIEVSDDSQIVISGTDFTLGSGLTWAPDGLTILGSGTITCKWLKEDQIRTIELSRNGTSSVVKANVLYCSPADITGDCIVNMQDLAFLASEWLKGKTR